MRSKRITRTRHYCDFCEAEGRKKGFWSRPSIEKHERGCTANPNRICGICEQGDLRQRPIAELIACISTDKPDCGMADLRKLSDGCPACILAGLRQSNIQKPPRVNGMVPADWEGPLVEFNFREELDAFWRQVNEDNLAASERACY